MYAAPVWLLPHSYKFNPLICNIMKKASGVLFNPDRHLLECLLNWLPLEIDIKIYITKFLLKHFCEHDSPFRNELINIHLSPRHPYYNHFSFLKEFIKIKLKLYRSSRLINLMENDYCDLANYSKLDILKFKQQLWLRLLFHASKAKQKNI